MSITRRLSTVRFIDRFEPGCTQQWEVAIIDGWRVVVGKGKYQVGQPVVYIEVDAFLPTSDPRFKALLGKGDHSLRYVDGIEGLYVKTESLDGIISQGKIFPLSSFPEVRAILNQRDTGGSYEDTKRWCRDEACFDSLLKIKKWESARKTTGPPVPYVIHGTDLPRAQNSQSLWRNWGHSSFQVTAKVDGQSMTAYFIQKTHPAYHHLVPSDGPSTNQPGGRFGVCSRNVEILEKNSSSSCSQGCEVPFWKVAKHHALALKLAGLNRSIAVQGELAGDCIQGDRQGLGPGRHEFYVFGVWDIDHQKRLPPGEVLGISKTLGLPHVPVLAGKVQLRALAKNHDELVGRAHGRGINGRPREGIVLKEIDGKCQFKVIDPLYLELYRI